MTFSITTFNIKTLSITTYDIKTLSITTFNIKALSITTFNIKPLSIMGLFSTFSITVLCAIMLGVVMLSVGFHLLLC
jgi:hypothetical protein